ncbi:porin [Paraburkholderia tropica]|uniref:porin n=1 Tax=Paraburkholderia tropica TaxID=92647 RepID=UPI002AB19A87|nr:porin [Paraburkholderia tropica]
MKFCIRKLAICIGASAFGFLHGASAFAQSNVNMYGIIDTFVGATQTPGTQRAIGESGGGLTTSFFGFSGSEDLGDGLKAIFALEAYFQPTTGASGKSATDSFFGRNAWVGLESDRYGTLRLGRLAPNLFIAAVKFNPFSNSFTFSPMMLDMYRSYGALGTLGDTDWSNAVAYMSPDLAGFHVGAQYAFGSTAGEGGAHKDDAIVMYDHGRFSAAAVYQYLNYHLAVGDIGTSLPGVPGLKSQESFFLGASWDAGFARLYGTYDRTSNTSSIRSVNVNSGQIGVAIPIGTSSILASWEHMAASNGDRRNTASVGYDYPLSKRTDLYAVYKYDYVAGDTSGQSMGVGIRHRF